MSIKSAFSLSMALSFVSGIAVAVIFILFAELLMTFAFYAAVGVALALVAPVAIGIVDDVAGVATNLLGRARNFFRKPVAKDSNVIIVQF